MRSTIKGAVRRQACGGARRSAGFTLVEMVVAVTLIALISLALWGALRISITSWKRGTETMDANQRDRATLDLMQKQMASVSALVPPMDLQLGIAQNPIFAGTESGVQFITQCSLRFRNNPGLTFVSYEIVPADQGEFALIERETRYLGGDPTQLVGFEGSNEPVTTIFTRLARAWFEYLDPGNEQIQAQWVTSWDAADMGRLPAAISLNVSAYGTDRSVQSRQMVIPLMADVDTNPQGLTDLFEGRMGGPGIAFPPGGRGGSGDMGRGRGGQGDRRGGPGDAGRGRGRGPGNFDPTLPGGRRGGR
jgi:prepilin-type N-terminal cleavage/methylation domain-containing protein